VVLTLHTLAINLHINLHGKCPCWLEFIILKHITSSTTPIQTPPPPPVFITTPAYYTYWENV
jgi:hypothetical protein